MKINRFFCLFFAFLMIAVPVDMKKKKKKEYVKCTEQFLRKAMEAAKNGEEAVVKFFFESLDEIGFLVNGIRSKSVATAWQSSLSGTSSKHVFSELQQIGRNIQSIVNKTKSCSKTERVKEGSDIKETPPVSEDVLFKTLSKNIKRIYEKNHGDVAPNVVAKKRTKRVEKLLKGFFENEAKPSLCSSPSQNDQGSKMSQKKDKILEKDFVKICLRMIEELLLYGVCEEVHSSFKTELNEFQRKINQSN